VRIKDVVIAGKRCLCPCVYVRGVCGDGDGGDGAGVFGFGGWGGKSYYY